MSDDIGVRRNLRRNSACFLVVLPYDVTLEPTTSFYTGETFKGYNNDKTCVAEPQNWALIRCAISPELSDFYEFGGGPEAAGSRGGNDNRYLECKAIGDHLEFESFQVKGLARRENFLDKSIQE
ncbi:hypothetical protein F2Q69_00018409 [Brassica cretica]|uniref:Uncharacterized protein n=1 Tax=Brassica cretica TaxID=69181 RepID=A0A8S9PWX0_BRACR|nr:hypothetical protein F2Q69_00018409 [Brassica cretica]